MQNLGKTIAVIHDVSYRYFVSENWREPLGEDHGKSFRFIQGLLPADDPTKFIIDIPRPDFPQQMDVDLSVAQIAEIKRGEKSLWVYGHLVYIDVLERWHVQSFCRWFGKGESQAIKTVKDCPAPYHKHKICKREDLRESPCSDIPPGMFETPED